MRSRVNIYGLGTNRGPATHPLVQIEDAEEVGISEYANDQGEAYFSLPYNHPAIALLKPLEQHIEVQRQASAGGTWTTLWSGLLSDFQVPEPDGVTYYADDYLSLLQSSMTNLKTKYTGKPVSEILQTEAYGAIRQSDNTASAAEVTLGVYAKPTAMAVHEAVNGMNQQAGVTCTCPEDGQIPRVGGWLRGYLVNCAMKLCVWNAVDGTLLASTATLTATGAAFLTGNILRIEADLTTALTVTKGQLVRFGWASETSHALMYAATGTGTTLSHTHYNKHQASWPGDVASASTAGGQIGAYGFFKATGINPNSRMGFVTIGTIDSVTASATITSDYQPRLEFMRSLVQIVQQGATTRPRMYITRTSPFTFNFDDNAGQDRLGVNLEYGGMVDSYRLWAGYGDLATRIRAVGQKLNGSAVLYSTQSSLSADQYGIIERPAIYAMLADQAAMDKITAQDARKAAQLYQNAAIVIRSNALAPYDGYDILDSVPLTIVRGPVNIDNSLRTIWGIEWIGHRDGSETTSLLQTPKLT
jgi:hypothetical protein